MIRVSAGIAYALTEVMDEAHCSLPTDDLMRAASNGNRAMVARGPGHRQDEQLWR
jgi:hypothetical protein